MPNISLASFTRNLGSVGYLNWIYQKSYSFPYLSPASESWWRSSLASLVSKPSYSINCFIVLQSPTNLICWRTKDFVVEGFRRANFHNKPCKIMFLLPSGTCWHAVCMYKWFCGTMQTYESMNTDSRHNLLWFLGRGLQRTIHGI